MKYEQMKKDLLGKFIDIDNFPLSQPYQCWDLVMWCCLKYYKGKVINCTSSGYVKDIAYNRQTNGILDFCEDIGLKAELKPGDICVWDECRACPYSHIAIYDHDEGQNAVYFLGQNQSNKIKVDIQKIDVSGIIGVFRPKVLIESEIPKLNVIDVNGYRVQLENGTATFTCDIPVNVRKGSPYGEIVAQYKKGQSVKYWGKYIGEKNRYVVFTGASGNTNFVAVSGSAQYGVDKWAECK